MPSIRKKTAPKPQPKPQPAVPEDVVKFTVRFYLSANPRDKELAKWLGNNIPNYKIGEALKRAAYEKYLHKDYETGQPLQQPVIVVNGSGSTVNQADEASNLLGSKTEEELAKEREEIDDLMDSLDSWRSGGS